MEPPEIQINMIQVWQHLLPMSAEIPSAVCFRHICERNENIVADSIWR